MKRALCMCLTALITACATIGSDGQGNLNLPTSGVGPFRKLGNDEEHGIPPYVLDDPTALFHEPCALALDADHHSTRVALYAVARSQGHDAIVRTHADDARSFFGGSGDVAGRSPAVVMRADQAWEGTDLSGPSVLRVGDKINMYYAANGAVGLAESSDGVQFTKRSSPVFTRPEGVSAPSVARLPDGRFRMLYTSGNAIYEAASTDGVTWTMQDALPQTPAMDPVLSAAPVRTDLAPGERPPFDTLAVTDPLLLVEVTPAGRLHMRVLYTGLASTEAGAPSSAIGFAARYGDAGPLSRNPLAVLSLDKHEAAPAYFSWLDGDPSGDVITENRFMLYVHMDQKGTASVAYPAIAAAFAPVSITLPTALAYPDSP
jgi:hypothetical protein